MPSKFYFLRSELDAEESAIFCVMVGSSKRERAAAAEISVRALLDDSIYFARADEESSSFVAQLIKQNPNREFYKCTAHQLLKFMESANSDYVENLSEQFRARWFQTLAATHQIIKL